MKTISPGELAGLMNSDGLYAVFDVRERGEFNNGQIPNSTSLPRSQIECRIAELVPNRTVGIVVYDDDGERAALAAHTLAEYGYRSVSVLEGGLNEWRKQGRPTASGVQCAEQSLRGKVQHERRIPEITPEELQRLGGRADLLILDMRTPKNTRASVFPAASTFPAATWFWAAGCGKPGRTVVVNCAGRTRSISARRRFRRLGLNNVRALRNGTMGWVLAGFDLESKPSRKSPVASAASRQNARSCAAAGGGRGDTWHSRFGVDENRWGRRRGRHVSYRCAIGERIPVRAFAGIAQHSRRTSGTARGRFHRGAQRQDHLYQQPIGARRDGRVLVSADGVS
jgi:rhodanese-related sulfurtransferase